MESDNRLFEIALTALLFDERYRNRFEARIKTLGEAGVDYREIIEKALAFMVQKEERTDRKALQSIFSLIQVSGKGWVDPNSCCIPAQEQLRSPLYPTEEANAETEKIESLFDKVWDEISDAKSVNAALYLLERDGSALPASGFDHEISLYDAGLTRAAIAVCLSVYEDYKEKKPEEPPFLLVGGDISGVQEFIYTLTSKGALKMLRARSFYVDLLLEHAVCDLLEELNLPRTQIIYTGGGGFYLLLPNTLEAMAQIKKTRDSLNETLFRRHNGTLYLAIQDAPCDLSHQGDISEAWGEVKNRLTDEKARKWNQIITELGNEIIWERHDCHANGCDGRIWECDVCHVQVDISAYDNQNEDKSANDSIHSALREFYHIDDEDETVHCCEVCYALYKWGRKLPKALKEKGFIHASKRKKINRMKQDTSDWNYCDLPIGDLYYDVDSLEKPIPKDAARIFLMNPDQGAGLDEKGIINLSVNKMIPYHVSTHAALKNDSEAFKTFEELAEGSKGANRIGALRMDVDHLGKIFSEGLGVKKNSLAHRGALSRAMTRFFKRHLDTILNDYRTAPKPFSVTGRLAGKREVTVVYAGGDDLFMVGGWSDLMEAAIEIRRSFVKYVCGNPGVTISGGIIVTNEHDPIYHLALETGLAEDAAKENGRDSLSLFYSSELAGDAEAVKESGKRGAPETMKELMRREEKEKNHARIGSMTWKWNLIDSRSGPFVPPSADTYGVVSSDLSVTGLLEGMMRDWTDSSRNPLRWKTSSNFLYSLLQLEGEYRSLGKIALPKLSYLLSRQGGASERGDHPERGIANWEGWKRVLHDPKAVDLLRPVLYWLIYLKREGS